jgi:hypothetical protein
MADDKTTEPELDEEGNVIPKLPTGEEEKKEEEAPESKEGESEGAAPAPQEEEKEEQIPVRKSVQQHIIARQKRTIEKLRSKTDEEEEALPSEEGEEDLSPEASKALSRAVEKRLAPVLNTFKAKVDDDELQGLLTEEPGSKKYEKRIKAWMAHENYAGVPPSVIYHHLEALDRSAETSKKKKVADVQADQMRGGGSQRRPTAKRGNLPTADEIESMDDAEFEKLESQARQGAFISKN